MTPEQSLQNRQAMAHLKKALSLYLRSTMKLKQFDYKQLAIALEDFGIELTESNLRTKISAGNIQAPLLILLLQILSCQPSALQDIQQLAAELMATQQGE